MSLAGGDALLPRATLRGLGGAPLGGEANSGSGVRAVAIAEAPNGVERDEPKSTKRPLLKTCNPSPIAKTLTPYRIPFTLAVEYIVGRTSARKGKSKEFYGYKNCS